MTTVAADAPIRDWLALWATPGLGPVRVARLVETFGTACAARGASASELGSAGINRADDWAVRIARAGREVDAILLRTADAGLDVVCPDDEGYPLLLTQLPDAPPVLWVRGTLEPRDVFAVGIVGSRRPGTYGREQSQRLGGLLARAGMTVVSGGAYGVDTSAHRGALEVMEGRTLVVLGCGADLVYPQENADLFARIADGAGAIVSEFPPGTGPRKEHFPRRNRIIVGLSRGVIVVEADVRSGALITARLAGEYGRPVMAVPGRLDNPLSAGPHDLIRDGATLVRDLEDVLSAIGPASAPARTTRTVPTGPPPQQPVEVPPAGVGVSRAVDLPDLPDEDRTLLACLDPAPLSIDALIDATGQPASRVTAAVTLLTIKGLLRRGSDGNVERVRR